MPRRDYKTPLILGCLFPIFKSDAPKTMPMTPPNPSQRQPKTPLFNTITARLVTWAGTKRLRKATK